MLNQFKALTEKVSVMTEQTKLGQDHWSESKETKRLLNVLEQLEAMAGGSRFTEENTSVRPSVADKVLAEENTRLKRANKEALVRLDKVITQINSKVGA